MIRRLLTLFGVIGLASFCLTGCGLSSEKLETHTAKVLTGRVSDVSPMGFTLSVDRENYESTYASSLKVTPGSETDPQTKDLLKELSEDANVSIYFYDDLSPSNATKISKLYRVEIENSAGDMCYGTTSSVPPAVIIGGKLYTDTGITTIETPSNTKAMGSINDSVDANTMPEGNSCCNFGIGHKFWKVGKNTVIVNVNEENRIFKENAVNLEKSQELNLFKRRNDTQFENYIINVEALNDYVLLREMRKNGLLSNNVTINNLTVDSRDPRMMNLDLSKDFLDFLFEFGSEGESAAIVQIVNSILGMHDMKSLRITVDGEWLKTDIAEDAIYSFSGARPNK